MLSDPSAHKINGSDEFKVNLVINDVAEVYVFHEKPFKAKLAWLEFNLDSHELDFVMSEGDIRSFGAKVPAHLAKYMDNAFQVMMVKTDEKTGEPAEGGYYPLIIHRAARH